MGALTPSLLAATFLIMAIAPSDAARILAVLPFPAKSHMVVFSSLTRELARRGHELVVVSTYPLSKPMANYTDIDISSDMATVTSAAKGEKMYDMANFAPWKMALLMWDLGTLTTSTFFKSPKVKELLKDKKGFDLVIAEAFMNEPIYGFAEHFQAPLVLVSPFGGFHWFNDYHGNPFPLSYVPNPILSFSDAMTFPQRILNTLITTFWDIGHTYYYLPRQDAIRKEVFGESFKSIKELERLTSLTLMNNHVSLSYPRPFLPNMVEVGGMHVTRVNNKLPSDIQKFLDDAKDGAIFFSMGSNLRSDQMPVAKRDAIIAAFAELPQRILWKWESDDLPGKTDNVKVGKWLPQQDILAHPNVRLFITHGGLLSAQEAIFHGVPVVGIPVFGDQSLNMNKAETGGYGLKIDYENLSKETLLNGIKKVLHDISYRREARRRSTVFRDQPEAPLERAVFWTEYILRHKGAPHLRSAALQLSWFQLWLLDVFAALLALIYIPYRLMKWVCTCCCKKTEKPKPQKQKAKKS